MISLLRLTKLAAPVLFAGTFAASATTLDFTTNPFAAGSIGSNGWTLTADPDVAVAGDIVANQAKPLLTAAGLVGDFDGVGVGLKNPDEVDRSEELVLEFDRKVRITNIYFLDLFIDADGIDKELASVTYGGGTVHFEAQAPDKLLGGFLAAATNLKGTSFTFFEAIGNDGRGVGDFALAGVTVEPVPLPAGMLLLGTALGGLGIARRRKKA